MELHRLLGLLGVIVLFVGLALLVYFEMQPIAPAGPPPLASASEAPGGNMAAASPEVAASGEPAKPRPAELAKPAQAKGEIARAAPSEGEIGGSLAQTSAAAAVPSFDIVRVESSGAAVIAGVAKPGWMVEVLDAGKPIARTKANESGEWAIDLDRPLTPGTHDLAIRATSENGASVMLSDQRVAVAVPAKPTGEPLVVLNTPDAASRIIEMPKSPPSDAAKADEPDKKAAVPKVAERAPAADMAPPALSAKPAGSQIAPKVVVTTVDADTAGNLFVAGTAAARDDPIRVYLDDALLGETKPTQDGTWLIEVHHELTPGTYKIRAEQVDLSSGRVIISAEVPFEREVEVAALTPIGEVGGPGGASAAGAMPDPQTVTVKRSENLWQISRRMYGNGKRWSTIYAANKEQIRNPRSILPGQVLTVPAGDMSWKN